MAALLLNPEPQFVDADGHPYAGGRLATYVMGTTVPKTTWEDPGATAANTNPIILDAAGRCIIYGDGEYRLVLHDAEGNLIWDQPSTTLISVCMAPVCLAPDLATARRLLGVDDAIAAEAAARAAADAAEAAARAAADAAEAAARIAGDSNLQTQITELMNNLADVNRRLTAMPTIKTGQVTTDSTGHARVTYPTAFPTATTAVCVEQYRGSADVVSATITFDAAGFDVWMAFPLTWGTFITPAGVRSAVWIATGY